MQLRYVLSKFILSTSIILSGALLSVEHSMAQTPPEVLSLYKEFKSAQKSGDQDLARDKALDAWQKAEKLLGDHKLTGDLANNFAYAGEGRVGYKLYKRRESAIKRSIELAKYHTEEADIRELERRLYLVSHRNTLRKRQGSKAVTVNNDSYFRDVEKALEKHQLLGSTFEADLEALKSRYYDLRKNPEQAILHANRALELYDSRTDNYSSAYLYLVRLYKGDILKSKDDKIAAVLEYQTVMQNLEGSLPSDHPFIANSFKKWLTTRYEIEEAGLMEKAEAAGMCECWPFEDYKSKPTPLKRVPPRMPRSARKSGHVMIKFDIDDNGKPIDIQKISSSNSLFDKAAVSSVEEWVYVKMTPDQKAKDRKNITNRITFRLTNSRGEVIPE